MDLDEEEDVITLLRRNKGLEPPRMAPVPSCPEPGATPSVTSTFADVDEVMKNVRTTHRDVYESRKQREKELASTERAARSRVEKGVKKPENFELPGIECHAPLAPIEVRGPGRELLHPSSVVPR